MQLTRGKAFAKLNMLTGILTEDYQIDGPSVKPVLHFLARLWKPCRPPNSGLAGCGRVKGQVHDRQTYLSDTPLVDVRVSR